MTQHNASLAPGQHRALRALIFDVDGTLAETEEVHRQCFNAALAAAGFDDQWSPARYGELLTVAGGKERLRHYFAQGGRALAAPVIADLHADKNARYACQLAASPPPLRPGVRALIDGARGAGLALAIATTTSASNLQALMAAHFGADWRDGFAAVLSAEDVQRKKPDPQVYTLALEQLGLGAEAALAIEDSDVGVAAARAAGVAVLATPSRYFACADLSAADLLLDDLHQPLADAAPPMGIAPLAEWFASRAAVS